MKNGKLIIIVLGLFLLLTGSVFSQGIASPDEDLFGSEDPALINADEKSLFGSDESIENILDEENLFGSEDDMFSDSSDLIEEVTDDQMEDLSTLLLTSDSGVEIGGDFFFNVTAGMGGIDPEDLSASDLTESLFLDLGASLYLDARPDEDSRVFAKAVVTSPFYTIGGPGITDGRKFEDIVTITELFADFNWDNNVFFRAGKQTVNWGVGRFFSPADLLSLSRIDPEAPDAELDGPIAIKINYPTLLNNYYLYTVVPADVSSFADASVAPMAEFVVGNSELAIGAYYQYNKAPTAMTTITTAIGDVSIYGEGYISYGSDKTFVESDGSTTITYNDTLFYKGTAGASYSWSDDLSNYNLSFAGQYYYNGEGYDDPNLVNMTSPSLKVLLANEDILASDLVENGKHYGAASVSWRKMWGSDFSLSVFYIENFSSLSGMVKPSISWGGLGGIDISLSASRMFGDAGEEYSIAGSTAAVSLGVSIGGTSF